jgi:CheY-like chemotaxis protein
MGPAATRARTRPVPPGAARRRPSELPEGTIQILVVDDEPDNQLLAERILSPRGYRVHRADDGLAACPILESTRIDLAIVDLMMPGMNGWELIRFIRGRFVARPGAGQANVKILVATSRNEPETLDFVRRLGANEVLLKPYTSDQLMTAIEALLGPQPDLPSNPDPDPSASAAPDLTPRRADSPTTSAKAPTSRKTRSKGRGKARALNEV